MVRFKPCSTFVDQSETSAGIVYYFLKMIDVDTLNPSIPTSVVMTLICTYVHNPNSMLLAPSPCTVYMYCVSLPFNSIPHTVHPSSTNLALSPCTVLHYQCHLP